MKELKKLEKRYVTVAWGIGVTWIGILGLVPGDQTAIGLLGLGLILLGLNLARFLSKTPINIFSIVLNSLVITLGLVAVLRPVFNFPHFELDFFSLVLIVIGLYILIPAPKRLENG